MLFFYGLAVMIDAGAKMPLHNVPGQIQQLTPPCDEHVPLRFCEQLYVWSLQTAVAVPHGAAIGDGTVQIFDPEGGFGTVGVGDGVPAVRARTKSTRASDVTVIVREAG